MNVRRFFHSEIPPAGSAFRISDTNEVRHLTGSLRLSTGDEVEVADGRGSLARARILSASKKEVTLEIVNITHTEPRREGLLCLAQAMLKGARMDWVVEKSVEGGVDALWTFPSRHSVPEEAAFQARQDRWNRIIHSALKQSGSLFAPLLANEAGIPDLIRRARAEQLTVLVLDPSHDNPPLWRALEEGGAEKDPGQSARGVLLTVGPEGGFSTDELQEFQAAGASFARLSSAVLRGETAAVSASSIARHWIDFFSPWAINAE